MMLHMCSEDTLAGAYQHVLMVASCRLAAEVARRHTARSMVIDGQSIAEDNWSTSYRNDGCVRTKLEMLAASSLLVKRQRSMRLVDAAD